MRIRFGQLHTTLLAKNYRFFTQGNYNLNIIGVRASDRDSNKFNDVLCVAFIIDKCPLLFKFPMTTDPGVYYRENPANVNGTAIVVPAQHRGVWRIGKHQGKYRALVQAKPMAVFRDNDCNSSIDIDPSKIERGMFGINCHHASAHSNSTEVGRWSAGCQVLADISDYNLFMAICVKAMEIHGNNFTYTLIQEADLR